MMSKALERRDRITSEHLGVKYRQRRRRRKSETLSGGEKGR